MSDQKPTLDYAPPPGPKPWPTWVVFAAMFLWPLIVIDIWSGAFISVVFTVLEVVNLFHPVSGLGTEGPGTIHWTKVSWLICNALLATIFVPLAIWHWRWRRRNRNRRT